MVSIDAKCAVYLEIPGSSCREAFSIVLTGASLRVLAGSIWVEASGALFLSVSSISTLGVEVRGVGVVEVLTGSIKVGVRVRVLTDSIGVGDRAVDLCFLCIWRASRKTG